MDQYEDTPEAAEARFTALRVLSGRMHALCRCVLLLVLALPAMALAQTPPVVAGDLVEIGTATKTVRGLLVDKVPDGYLVQTDAGNVLVRYTEVTSVTKVTPAAGAPAMGVVAPRGQQWEPGDTPAMLGPKFWGYLFLRFAQGTQARELETAAGDVAVDEIFMGGGGADVPVARFLNAAFGAYYAMADADLEDVGPNATYDTYTVFIDAQVRPSFRVGRARMWAGGGIAYAFVESTYDKIPGDPGKKTGRSHNFGPLFGGGVDFTLMNARNPKAGPDLLVTFAVESGAPTFDETFASYDFGGETKKDVGFAVPPMRAYAGIGLGFGGGR